MRSTGTACLFVAVLALAVAGVARADSIDGVIASYESGNQGTDITIRTSDGREHVLWFDNMKKPLFGGTALPWCPDFPCTGWPKALVLNKTQVLFRLAANASKYSITNSRNYGLQFEIMEAI